MKLLEAVQSGRRFRRSMWSHWIQPPHIADTQVRIIDAIADDWEIDEARVTVTSRDIRELIRGAAASYNPPDTITLDKAFDHLLEHIIRAFEEKCK